ncbi:hypothetical protein GALMADRAFT_160420 [Galerina marginata CBS 339.88]|uniref:F-box domain-containing protein n=1 Tax=Galerina marginata (strain CBS 339.88) TaxID=685588 RepID=A0A067SHB3_GALM3|nr:hypothetical protein GALMADRAFT_160420 [Galerina marginata CBS 339.88]
MEEQHDGGPDPNSNVPIFRLDSDILWRIFALNADLEGFTTSTGRDNNSHKLHPLNVTRYSSQVCYRWRKLIIGFSSIWAGLIDLDLLNAQAHENWMNEVMRRTGQSLLSVIGYKELGPHPGAKKLFISLLTDHWWRVRKFKVAVLPSKFDSSLWDSLWTTPSPHLEEFSLEEFSRFNLFPSEPRSDALFADHAPSLRNFRCTNIGFNYRASWIPQLRSLTIQAPLNVQTALDVLSRTRNLEELKFEDVGIRNPMPIDRSRVDLPNVHRIQGNATLRTALTILEHISHSAVCELGLHLVDHPQSDAPEREASLKALFQIVSRFTENHLIAQKQHAPECAVATGFGFFSYTPPHNWHATRKPSFIVNLETYEVIPIDGIFPTAYRKAITHFTFMHKAAFSRFKDPTLDNFLLSLIRLKTLQLSQYAVNRIFELFLKNATVFPLLSVLQLRFSRGEQLVGATRLSLVSFLLGRKSASIPVEILDIADWDGERPTWIKLGFLEEVVGLKVFWCANGVDGEYICGSGSPEKLDFCQLSG